MTNLILHVGPPKCGSKSIQEFFATQNRPCVQNIHYIMLKSSEISDLNCEEPNESILAAFTKLIMDNLVGCDVLILSHEYLYECRYAIRNICNLAKNLVADMLIIGFSRRQSDFLISEYSQWGFRLPDRIKEVAIILEKSGLDPILFSGLEQRLIASIIDDFYVSGYGKYRLLDWYNYYKEIIQLTHESGAVVKCGVLPKHGADNTLIQDFCEKSGLTLLGEAKNASQQIRNISFNQEIIEAIHNAVVFGLDMPGLHERNDVLEMLSIKVVKTEKKVSSFLSYLKSYIDNYFFSSNQKFCQEYGINDTYFSPSAQFSKQEILDLITRENQQRTLNKSLIINNYRILSARMIELCFKLIKEDVYKK